MSGVIREGVVGVDSNASSMSSKLEIRILGGDFTDNYIDNFLEPILREEVYGQHADISVTIRFARYHEQLIELATQGSFDFVALAINNVVTDDPQGLVSALAKVCKLPVLVLYPQLLTNSFPSGAIFTDATVALQMPCDVETLIDALRTCLSTRKDLQAETSQCSVCGKSYRHCRGYRPLTCGRVDCVEKLKGPTVVREREINASRPIESKKLESGAPREDGLIKMQTCNSHPDREPVAMCVGCGNFICTECRVSVDGRNFCKTCVAAMVSYSPPHTIPNPVQQPGPSTAVTVSHYVGVRGWLLFLCVSLTILSPLGSLILTPVGLLPGNKTTIAILLILVNAFSIYAGVELWKRRPGAVAIAKAFLIVNVIFQLWLGYRISLLPDFQPIGYVRILFSTGIFFAVWYSYLTWSKRVEATYSGSRNVSDLIDRLP